MTTPAKTPSPCIELPALVRLEADYLAPGPRDALLQVADELESDGNPVVISLDALFDAISASTTLEHATEIGDQQEHENTIESGAGEPLHVSLPPHLRRSAYRRPDGPDRDSLLRLANELEEKGDASLVSSATLRAALKAHATEDD